MRRSSVIVGRRSFWSGKANSLMDSRALIWVLLRRNVRWDWHSEQRLWLTCSHVAFGKLRSPTRLLLIGSLGSAKAYNWGSRTTSGLLLVHLRWPAFGARKPCLN